jgi:hypothetical protein
MSDNAGVVVQAAGGSAGVATILGLIPGVLGTIAAICSIVWFIWSVYTSKPAQVWLEARRARRYERKIKRLMAQEKITKAKIDAIELKRRAGVVADNLVVAATAEAKEIVRNDAVKASIDKIAP